MHRAAVPVRAALELAVELCHQFVRSGSFRERVPVRTVGRRDDVPLLQRAADADGDGLLADRHVQEPGELARTEAFLDLLLEAADQQHLAEEVAEVRARKRPFLLNLCHGLSLCCGP